MIHIERWVSFDREECYKNVQISAQLRGQTQEVVVEKGKKSANLAGLTFTTSKSTRAEWPMQPRLSPVSVVMLSGTEFLASLWTGH